MGARRCKGDREKGVQKQKASLVGCNHVQVLVYRCLCSSWSGSGGFVVELSLYGAARYYVRYDKLVVGYAYTLGIKSIDEYFYAFQSRSLVHTSSLFASLFLVASIFLL